jgi:hypothetical protein
MTSNLVTGPNTNFSFYQTSAPEFDDSKKDEENVKPFEPVEDVSIHEEPPPRIEYSRSFINTLSQTKFIKTQNVDNNKKYEVVYTYDVETKDIKPKDDVTWKAYATSLPKNYIDIFKDKKEVETKAAKTDKDYYFNKSRSSSRIETARTPAPVETAPPPKEVKSKPEIDMTEMLRRQAEEEKKQAQQAVFIQKIDNLQKKLEELEKKVEEEEVKQAAPAPPPPPEPAKPVKEEDKFNEMDDNFKAFLKANLQLDMEREREAERKRLEKDKKKVKFAPRKKVSKQQQIDNLRKLQNKAFSRYKDEVIL